MSRAKDYVNKLVENTDPYDLTGPTVDFDIGFLLASGPVAESDEPAAAAAAAAAAEPDDLDDPDSVDRGLFLDSCQATADKLRALGLYVEPHLSWPGIECGTGVFKLAKIIMIGSRAANAVRVTVGSIPDDQHRIMSTILLQVNLCILSPIGRVTWIHDAVYFAYGMSAQEQPEALVKMVEIAKAVCTSPFAMEVDFRRGLRAAMSAFGNGLAREKHESLQKSWWKNHSARRLASGPGARGSRPMAQ